MPSINEERLSDRDLVRERLKQKEYHDRKKASERKIPNANFIMQLGFIILVSS